MRIAAVAFLAAGCAVPPPAVRDREDGESRQERLVLIRVSLAEDGEQTGRGIVTADGRAFVIEDGPDKGGFDAEGLARFLRAEAEAYGRWEPSPTDPGEMDSLLPVLIRADERVRGEYLQAIYEACISAGIFKVELAGLRDDAPDPEAP